MPLAAFEAVFGPLTSRGHTTEIGPNFGGKTPAAAQGWAQADFHCGRCGDHITVTTEDEYVLRVTSHRTAHDLMDAATPELRAKLTELALAEFPPTLDHGGPSE
ncbi:hypothetical protein AB0451_39385 [Streptomyces sp. NPDC052000]|uniref:hypothetical protein n=1 Tax=Streptomyces sp. NPDC052000 TaxID=3155676 RepID=UPI00344C707E